MKRSEMEGILTAWRGGVNWPREICDEMEAKGQVWDPEEEPLPERLAVTSNGAYIRVDASEDAPFLAIIKAHGTWDAAFAKSARVASVMIEAVRRYNAWPELRKIHRRLGNMAWGDDEDRAMIQDDLLAILADREPAR